MNEEELEYFKEVLESEYPFNIINTVYLKNVQFMIGIYKGKYFTFGMKNESFYVLGHNMNFITFRDLTKYLSDFLGEEPWQFIEKGETKFIYFWTNSKQSKILKEIQMRNESFKRNTFKQLITFNTEESLSKTKKRLIH